jgi:hypothetical protein
MSFFWHRARRFVDSSSERSARQMAGTLRLAIAATVGLLLPTAVLAQVPPARADGFDTERWDVVIALGHTVHEDLPPATFGIEHLLFDNWEGTVRPRFYLGYYWTPHLKTDARVMLPRRVSAAYFGEFPVPGLPDGGYMSTDSTTDIHTLAVGASYQFFENTFVHPYVSSGLQLERRREHWFRAEAVHTGYVGPFPSTPVRYPVPGLDARSTRVLVRPYVAGGAKVYFTTRLFTRVEALIGVTRTYEAGVGLDF